MGQHAVNIAAPLDGEAVENYVNFNFSTTCSGGQHTVEWYLDGKQLGSATFYSHFSAQFAYKVASGKHEFTVKSSCGGNSVTFVVN